jgi:uncharacterized protein (DUF2062 family)
MEDEAVTAEATIDDTPTTAPRSRVERPPAHWFSWWGQVRWFVVHRILHAQDSPHRLALGVAIGMWVALLPLVGVQMVTSAALVHPFKGNKVVAMAMAWVSNPLTLIPVYLPCYWLGAWLLGMDAIPYHEFVEIFFPPESVGWWGTLSATWSAMMAIFLPLWLGCGIVATAVSVPLYFVTERVVTWYRVRRYGTVDLSSSP